MTTYSDNQPNTSLDGHDQNPDDEVKPFRIETKNQPFHNLGLIQMDKQKKIDR